MPSGGEYRRKVIELCALAKTERNDRLRVEFQQLAFAYIRLAHMADRNQLLEADTKFGK
jgi:hypothetical protein